MPYRLDYQVNVNSLSHFSFTVWTHTHGHKVTDATEVAIHRLATASMD